VKDELQATPLKGEGVSRDPAKIYPFPSFGFHFKENIAVQGNNVMGRMNG
jgi:hypothetical protein